MTEQMKVAIAFVTCFLIIVIGLTFYTMKKSKAITEKSIDIRKEAIVVQKETNQLLTKLISLIEAKQ